jgi:CubicO group peptidase (beta-lactamase class C family)
MYCLASIALLSCKKEEQPPSTSEITIRTLVDKEARAFLQDSLLTSVSIGIYRQGEKITAHYGELDKGQNNTPTDETIYEIASVSKTFTGTLVAQAVLDGKLTIEDDIRIFLGEEYNNLAYENDPVRIKHLLFHQAGFPQFLPETVGALMTEFTPELPSQIHAIQSKYNREAFLKDVQQIELTAAPGTHYGYSNVDVELMAYILEQIYHESYEELVTKYITDPAKMPKTKVTLTEKERPLLANGYGMQRIAVPHFSNTLSGADGGLKSTSEDLTYYMEFLLDNTNPLSVESKKVLLDLNDYATGYFWSIRQTTDDGIYYNHHGGAFGTQNWFYLYPKYNLGISVITNQSDLQTAGKLQHLVEGIFESVSQMN